MVETDSRMQRLASVDFSAVEHDRENERLLRPDHSFVDALPEG